MRKDFIYVSIQFVLFLIYVFDINFFQLELGPIIKSLGWVISVIGALLLVLAILQLNKNLSPFPTPRVNGELITNGLYGFVRHPIYTGIIMGSMGYGIISESLWKLSIGFGLFTLFHFKAKYEEQLLKDKFSDYNTYLLKTGRFFPRLLRTKN